MATAEISAKEVFKLRKQTGAGMMDCKKALIESDGDFDAAIEIWDSEFGSTFSKKIKKRTSFNLAVGYEAKADYEKAIYWVKESLRYGHIKTV